MSSISGLVHLELKPIFFSSFMADVPIFQYLAHRLRDRILKDRSFEDKD